MSIVNDNNDPSLRSFVPVAADSHFPIQNLPFGVFRPRAGGSPRGGVAIGEVVLDLSILEERGFFAQFLSSGQSVFNRSSLNAFFALGREVWRAVRIRVSQLLRDDEPTLRDDAGLRAAALVPQREVEMCLPVEIGDYTDFYSSREHATNVGTMIRGPENALNPNWLHLPVAYHGRASSIVVSGTDFHRPLGQRKPDGGGPVCGPSRTLDFELEVGAFVGTGNPRGEPIPIDRAEEHIFGLVLVNDWSARDIQKWEYVPLGPFLAKNFCTSISPWVVPLDALEPFRVAGPPQDPPPLDYLKSPGAATFDIHLEAWLAPGDGEPARISATSFRHLYWSLSQQVAHHTINGCNLRPGDLLASGTISGPTPDSFGSLLELTWGGSRPLELPGGQARRFLEDGDRLTLTGWCQANGYRVGFGEATAKVLPPM